MISVPARITGPPDPAALIAEECMGLGQGERARPGRSWSARLRVQVGRRLRPHLRIGCCPPRRNGHASCCRRRNSRPSIVARADTRILVDLPAVEEWIRMHADPVGPIETAHERPWATVLRVPLADSVAWFKACAPVQTFETRLTADLFSRWPDRVPEVLAYHEQRAWLLLADAGMSVGVFGNPPQAWLTALPRYAELQRGEAVNGQEHLAHGVPDLRLVTLPARYEELLELNLPLQQEEIRQLRHFASRFAELCDDLAAYVMPSHSRSESARLRDQSHTSGSALRFRRKHDLDSTRISRSSCGVQSPRRSTKAPRATRIEAPATKAWFAHCQVPPISRERPADFRGGSYRSTSVSDTEVQSRAAGRRSCFTQLSARCSSGRRSSCGAGTGVRWPG